MMLTIDATLAQAMESGTLTRWQQEIAARIARDFPDAQTDLQTFVQNAVATIRRAGATSRADMELYAHALYRATQTLGDPQAMGDLTAIMTAQTPYATRMKTLAKAFPL